MFFFFYECMNVNIIISCLILYLNFYLFLLFCDRFALVLVDVMSK